MLVQCALVVQLTNTLGTELAGKKKEFEVCQFKIKRFALSHCCYLNYGALAPEPTWETIFEPTWT